MSVDQKPGDGNWFYRFKHNKKSYFKGGYPSQKLAKEAEIKRKNQVIIDEIHPERIGQDMTFEQGASMYLEEYCKLEKRKGSWQNDVVRIPRIVKFYAGRKLIDIQPEDVSRLREHLRSLRLSEHTVNHHHALLKAMFNWLKKFKRLRWIDNPAYYISMAQVPVARVRFLYPSEEQLLTPKVRAHELWPYYYIALHTGMRESEICNIQVKDVYLAPMNRMFIPQSKNHRSGYVPLSSNLETFLRPYLAGKGPEDYLLTPHRHRCTVGHWFSKIVASAGVTDFTFHDLRHTFAANLLAAGADIYKVSKILRHSSVKVTEAHYGHLDIKWLQETVAKIDGTITPSAPEVNAASVVDESFELKSLEITLLPR
jgi:integrase